MRERDKKDENKEQETMKFIEKKENAKLNSSDNFKININHKIRLSLIQN